MRTVLAAAAAGALLLGSAGGAVAHPAKSGKSHPAPNSIVKLQSVSIKGHKPIDLAKVDATTALTLRASVRDPKNVVGPASTIDVTLGIFNKKVNGTQVDGTDSLPTTLVLKPTTESKKWKRFTGSAVLATVWDADQIGVLKELLKPGDKAYACIDEAMPSFTVDKYSMQSKKRLAKGPKKPVRDCVKVIDSTPEEIKS
jgi:hypothetical protein